MQENRCGNKLGQKWVGRLISVFLVLTMLLGIMPVSVFAAQDSDTLSDIPGIGTIENQQSGSLSDFYNVEDTTTLSDDTATSTVPNIVDGAYQIGTAAELKWFASAVNDGTAETQNAVLTANIDLNNQEWTAIGNSDAHPYRGTFDGANHTVHNLSVTTGAMYVGLVGYMSEGTVKNVTVDGNITISGYTDASGDNCAYIAGIVGWACGDVLNCTNKVNITISDFKVGWTTVGGVCGTLGTVDATYTAVGCSNTGNINCSADPSSESSGELDVAGVIGSLDAESLVDSSKNSGSVTALLAGFGSAYYGGISNVVGTASSVNVNNCFNTGTVSGSVKAGLGGCTLGGGSIGAFGGEDDKYPTNCAYLSTTSTVGISNMSGLAIADAISGIFAKTTDELKSAEFLAALNSAAPIADYAVTWVTGTDGYPTISNIQAAAGIKSFTVAGVNATIDQKAHTITAELPAGTDLTNLVPTIVCFANATSTPASGAAQDFTKPVVYTAGSVSYKVTLTVAEPDFLGNGTQDDPYRINSAKLLLKLSTEYNKDPASFAGKHWKQTAEIDMTGVKFTPIGISTAFSGTYDGGNHAIKNLTIASAATNVGLFGTVGNNAVIKNVVLDDTCAISASNKSCRVGGIAGYINASGTNIIENCVNRATVTSSATPSFGSSPSYAGGIVGVIASSKNNLVIGCKNYGAVKQTVEGVYYAGGIAGSILTNTVVSNCENHGTVTALSGETWGGLGNGSTAGGIAASSAGYVSGCSNDGAVTAGMYVGGIVGQNLSGAVVESCYNAGPVAGNSDVANCALGGIAGDSSSAVLNKCYNVGICTPHNNSATTKYGHVVGVCRNAKELSGNYFLGTELSQGYGEYTTGQTPSSIMMMAVEDAWLKSSDAVALLNNYSKPYSLYKATWTESDGYPVFSKVEKILSHYKEIKTFTVTIEGTTYAATITGTDISIVLPAGVTSITPTITISDNATISPASGATVTLTDGTATFTVTAENGDTATYTLRATIPSEATGLAALQVYTATHTLLAASDFKQNTTEYTADIHDTNVVHTASSTELYFKVIPATSTATVTAALNDGDPITLTAIANMNTNTNSGYIRLWDNEVESNRPVRVGENTVTITVTPAGKDESSVVRYTLKFTVVPTLSSLTITGNGKELSLNKTFNANEFEYTMEVPDDVTELTISAVARMTGKATVSLPQGASDDGKLDITNLDKLEIKVGDTAKQTTYTITLNKRETYSAQIVTDPAGAAVSVKPASGDAVTPDANGVYKLLVGETYTVKATKPGYVTATATIGSAADLVNGKLTIKLTPVNNPLPDYDGDWTSFRGSDNNMAIVNAPMPMNAADAAKRWVTNGSASYSSSITPPLIINGYLYVQSGRKVLKIDPANGSVQAEGAIAGSSQFTTNPLGYGEGMIFAAIDGDDGKGCIQALNAETLQSLWFSEKVSGQMISPITYHNGYIYTGTWNSETETGTYFALPVTDQNTSSTNETQDVLWRVTHMLLKKEELYEKWLENNSQG